MKGFCFELIQIDGHSNEYSDYFFVIDSYEKARSVLKDSEYTSDFSVIDNSEAETSQLLLSKSKRNTK